MPGSVTPRPLFARELRRDCIAAKEALSADLDATVAVMLPNIQSQVRITRAEFENMIRSMLRETIDSLRRAISAAGINTAQIKAILLTGGSSRIPIISEAEAHAMQPDYLLVLPWHFRRNLLQREAAYLQRDGKMIFPLPQIEIVGS